MDHPHSAPNRPTSSYAGAATLTLTHDQVVSDRLRVNHLDERLSRGSYAEAARFSVQDSGPRDGVVGLHARVADCSPAAWADPSLTQAYSPRAAVHLLPVNDFGVFTIGRLPLDPEERQDLLAKADVICRQLDGREGRSGAPHLRLAAASGRIALRWTTSALYFREVPAPEIDLDVARRELCRRHIHAFGPTTPAAFAWWAGLRPVDGRAAWQLLQRELTPVMIDKTAGWIISADEEAVRRAQPVQGVRLLPVADIRLFSQDRSLAFVGPGERRPPPTKDSFHPHPVMTDGKIIGAWGRKGTTIQARVVQPLSDAHRDALETEASTLPIAGPRPQISITELTSQRR